MENKEFNDLCIELNKDQEKAIELDIQGKTELANFHYESGRKLQSEKVIKDILEEERVKEQFKQQYYLISEIIKDYCDIREEYLPLVTTWILGTYLHDSFETYPYLFINAMRGSGKSRLLRLIACLSKEGRVIGSPTEAVLFRMPKGNTMCLDEFEGVNKKENAGIRELLNACYKKGMTIQRVKKQKSIAGEEMIIEDFEPYKPICMANIWGMEEVLGDRCVTLILEKSSRMDITKIIEDFSTKPSILAIKSTLNVLLVQLCSYFSVLEVLKRWNLYIKWKYTTLTTHTTHTTLTTLTTSLHIPEEFEIDFEMFEKIDETGINGRNLELFLPLLLIGKFISKEVFESLLNVAKMLNSEKKENEMTESRDVALFEFVSKLGVERNFIPIKDLTNRFRIFVGDDELTDEQWLNVKWFGRAIGRLNLVLDKRRTAKGIEVTLNVEKALEKIKIFRKKDE